jgi:phosphoketolase
MVQFSLFVAKSENRLPKMDAYWRVANYAAVAQIYLYENPLLKESLKLSSEAALPSMVPRFCRNSVQKRTPPP